MDRVRTFGLAGIGGIFVVVTVLVGLALQRGSEVAPPQITTGVMIAVLLVTSAAIGVLGIRRRSSVLLTAAGVAALGPGWLSPATLQLVIAAALLLIAGRSAEPPGRRAEWLVVAAIFALNVGALASMLTLNETRCWLAYSTADGYRWEFVTEAAASGSLGGPGQPVASGCDGGMPTTGGIGLAAVLAIGALALAAAVPKPASKRPER